MFTHWAIIRLNIIVKWIEHYDDDDATSGDCLCHFVFSVNY